MLEAGGLTLDPASHEVRRDQTEIELTPREFALLEVLMERAGEAVTRFDLLERVWDDAYENSSNVIDVYVGYLREKLGAEHDRDGARRRLPAGRVSLRARVTLAFTAVLALVLVAAGAFLYVRFSSDLQDQQDRGLRSRAGQLAGAAERGRPGPAAGRGAGHRGRRGRGTGAVERRLGGRRDCGR